jgi:acetyl esterase/lipase
MVATMSYTLLNGQYKEYNIFRIIDEITAVLKNLKRILKEQGFDENKLELVISGGSAGAHLSTLYGYLIKNPPIPIKFIVNIAAPITLIPKIF